MTRIPHCALIWVEGSDLLTVHKLCLYPSDPPPAHTPIAEPITPQALPPLLLPLLLTLQLHHLTPLLGSQQRGADEELRCRPLRRRLRLLRLLLLRLLWLLWLLMLLLERVGRRANCSAGRGGSEDGCDGWLPGSCRLCRRDSTSPRCCLDLENLHSGS